LGSALHLDIGDEAVFILVAKLGDFFAGFNRGHQAPPAAASASLRPINRLNEWINASISVTPCSGPKLARNAQRARLSSTFIASRTCDGETLPDEQAAPELTQMPSRSNAINVLSACNCGMAKQDKFFCRTSWVPKTTAFGSMLRSDSSK